MDYIIYGSHPDYAYVLESVVPYGTSCGVVADVITALQILHPKATYVVLFRPHGWDDMPWGYQIFPALRELIACN